MKRLFTYIAVILCTFGTRKLLGHITQGFDEYESFFIYLSDLVLAVPIFLIIKNRYFPKVNPLLIGFIALSFFSIFYAFSIPLAIYSFARLLLVILAAVSVAILIQKEFLKIEWIFGGLAITAVIQSAIGVGQFIFQKSLGLTWLGEPVIGPDIGGSAKIVVEGVRILRAYGTFPHPNVLAAFLLLGLISLCYFWFKIDANIPMNTNYTNPVIRIIRTHSYIGIALGIFIVSLGLVLAFSRAAWLVGGIVLLFVVGRSLLVKEYFRQGVRLAIFLIPIISLLFFSFRIYTFPRAAISSSEPAVTQRLSYNQLGLELIKIRPFGVGIGNQVLYAVKNEVYQDLGMNEVWQWQPIHNIYLLIASEIGILGLLIFLIFLSRLIILNSLFTIPTMMFSTLLLLGLFDHYLWTLEPGRIMLWLVIGLVLAQGALSRSRTLRGATRCKPHKHS